MQKIFISDLSKYVGKEIKIQGWLYNKRSSGKLHFLILRDGTGYLQCVFFKGNVDEAAFDLAGRIGQETSIEVTGRVKEEKRAPGGFELDASDLMQINKDMPTYDRRTGNVAIISGLSHGRYLLARFFCTAANLLHKRKHQVFETRAEAEAWLTSLQKP